MVSQNTTRRSEGRWLSTRGFTLVEMMTVSAVITIVSMMAVPAYMQWNTRYQLTQASEEVSGNLKLARVAAMSRGASVTVTLAIVGGKATLSSGGVFPPVTLPQGVVGVTAGTVTFSPLGLRSSGGAGNQTFQITGSNGTVYTVVVAPSGKVNWCKSVSCP